MHRSIRAAALSLIAAGCAVVKTTDVTDASFKRHQSVSVLGWPVYSRVTDREPGASPNLATRRDLERRAEFPPELPVPFRSEWYSGIEPAEMIDEPIDVELSREEK